MSRSTSKSSLQTPHLSKPHQTKAIKNLSWSSTKLQNQLLFNYSLMKSIDKSMRKPQDAKLPHKKSTSKQKQRMNPNFSVPLILVCFMRPTTIQWTISSTAKRWSTLRRSSHHLVAPCRQRYALLMATCHSSSRYRLLTIWTSQKTLLSRSIVRRTPFIRLSLSQTKNIVLH